MRSCILPQLLNTPDRYKNAKERINREEENRFRMFTKHPPPLLARDQKVWLLDRITKRWNIPAEVRGCRPNGKSYILQTSRGGVFLRNSRMIKPRQDDEEEGKESQEDQEAGKQEEGEEKKQEGPRGEGGSDFTRVQTEQLGQPANTAVLEKANRLGAGGRGRPGAGVGARPGQAETEAPRRKTYREVLCGDQQENVDRRITRGMTKT